ncbi:MAG: DUF1080 domain-containing protein [Bryobacteraceae bacterium]
MFRCFILAALGCAAAAGEEGFKPLFDGKTLNGWKLVQPRGPGWTVEDGAIVCPQGGGGKLMTTEEYGDFILRLEYRLAPAGNNGVNIRAPYEGRPAYVGMEIQILDDANEKWRNIRSEQKTGSVYDVIPARTGFARPAGEWNEMEITARGRQITVALNGVIVTDVNLDIVREPQILEKHPGIRRNSGYLGLLGHNTRTEFRNLRVKKL